MSRRGLQRWWWWWWWSTSWISVASGEISLTRCEGQTERGSQVQEKCVSASLMRADNTKPALTLTPKKEKFKSRIKKKEETLSAAFCVCLYFHKAATTWTTWHLRRLICFRLAPSRCCHNSERLRSPVPPPMAQRAAGFSGKCSTSRVLGTDCGILRRWRDACWLQREFLQAPLTLARTLPRSTGLSFIIYLFISFIIFFKIVASGLINIYDLFSWVTIKVSV